MVQIALVILFSQYLSRVEIPMGRLGKMRLFQLFPVVLAIVVCWIYAGTVCFSCDCAVPQMRRPLLFIWSLMLEVLWLTPPAVPAVIMTEAGVYNSNPSSPCRTDQTDVLDAAPWFYFPYPFQWGAPTFDAGYFFAMLAGTEHAPTCVRIALRRALTERRRIGYISTSAGQD